MGPRCLLRTMHGRRGHWLKYYLNDIFWGGMTITGRNESMDAYFDVYVHSNIMLNEFIDQYDKAVMESW